MSDISQNLRTAIACLLQAARLVLEFAKCSPETYTAMGKQGEGHQPAVRRLGEMLAKLAELMPKVVNNQMSLLQPYLGCGASTLRGAIVSAVGSVLISVSPWHVAIMQIHIQSSWDGIIGCHT
jgi:hypothetical protein